MDTRTVISGITFNEISPILTVQNKSKLKPNLNLDKLFCFVNSNYSLHSFDEILNWITKLKCYYELLVTKKPLKEIIKWNINQNEIVHQDNLYFKIIGTEIEINNREVKKWNQPLIVPLQNGIFAFVIKKINNTYHFLVQAKVEPGNFDIIELAPTVQCITGSYSDSNEVPFLKTVLNARDKNIIYDTLQSEEGGRFYQEENRNMIIEVDDHFPENIPDNFIWISFNQLTLFLKFNNYLNIQSRSLISSIQFI
jgi:oxidase EvaA